MIDANGGSKRIGVTIFFQSSFFSSGSSTTSFTLADALTALGHSVVLVNLNQTVDWFDDCKAVKDEYVRRNLVEWTDPPLDFLIDVDGFLNPSERRKVAEKVVVFIRKPTALYEMERLVYPMQGPLRNLLDCDAIWTWSEFGKQDVQILELFSEKPVFQLPFTWSPKGTDGNDARKDGPSSSWLEASQGATSWTCKITETNFSVGSSCTLPLVIAAYAKTHSRLPVHTCTIHNSDGIQKSQFFKDNVLAHCQRPGLDIQLVGRQRIGDWQQIPKSFVLSHTRFQVIRPYLLDCVWNGIPVIHSSPWLRDVGCGLERFYYPDNSVKGATKAMDQMLEDYSAKVGFFAPDGLERVKAAIRQRLDVRAFADEWSKALCFEKSSGIAATATEATEAIAETKPIKSVLRVGFSDLWAEANCEYNFWTLLLEEACRRLKNPLKIEGVRVTEQNMNEPIDVLFYGPFGNTWRSIPASVPKVHITGENSPSSFGHGTYLNLGFDATDETRGIYRFPLWMQYIDWFGADQERLRNPRTMPIDCFLGHSEEELKKKQKFCAFIVSNPTNPIRNAAFQWLSLYKHVDSAGRLFNNVGDALFTEMAGGGGGELKKLAFLNDYKFCLTYENSRRDGYVTEKLLAAKAAGCVPIYWGAENVSLDFAEGSFINANDFRSADDLISAVRALEEDAEKWLAMASKPAFSIGAVRKKLAEVARLILTPLLGSVVNSLPTALGASSTAEAQRIGMEREGSVKSDGPSKGISWNRKILLTTFASHRFLESLAHWIGSAELHAKTNSNLSIRVYLGEDIDEITQNLLKSEHPTVQFQRVPSKAVCVEGFADLWEPQHFAWKLWILQELVREEKLKGTCVLYTDSGSLLLRLPLEWLEMAAKGEGISMLEDKEQKNDQWCHEVFCNRLNVSAEEKAEQQIAACILTFVGGAVLPWKVFTEAWVYGQQRDLIVGPKWAGFLPDGRPYGHRHDQSILSLLRLRYKVPVYPLEKVYNHESIRRTLKSGASIYVHRGKIQENVNFAPRIGEVHLINLRRREDRIQRFKANHGPWTKEVFLRTAFDGRRVSLTPDLARLFVPNDFHWKKSVLGCALSHLQLWMDLVNEYPCCENYLILEDDVKFRPDWLEIWKEAASQIPEDYDVLYLGGVLPPNREVFQHFLEPVNPFWARVAPNTIFGQPIPTRYFHFCNYAYILSRAGAKKILDGMAARGGYYTSADHMICNRIEDLKHYVLTPQVAGCYQDDDPKYTNAVFNDYSRIDGFDSDLWNNDERFSAEEVKRALDACENTSVLTLEKVLKEASIETPVQMAITKPNPQSNARFYTVGEHQIYSSTLLEYSWLKTLFGKSFETIEHLPLDHEPLSTQPIFIVMKPHWNEYLPTFLKYQDAKKDFRVLHLSDEYNNDPIDWYALHHCRKIVRMYPRETPCPEKVLTLPLGPRHLCNEQVDLDLSNRPLVWSFLGTKWNQRQERLAPFLTLGPNLHKFFDNWMDSQQLNAKQYSEICLQSQFLLCPPGQNVETFRFWEALEHGAIPVYVREKGDELYYHLLSQHLPLVSFHSWDHAASFITSITQNHATLAQYRKTMLEKWSAWKKELIATCHAFVDVEKQEK